MVQAITLLAMASVSVQPQPLSDLLRCREAGPDLPRVGLYSILADGRQHVCVAPAEDADGTSLPCLRVGTIFVGMDRVAVERILGKPSRRLRERLPSLTSAAYVIANDSVSGAGAYFVLEYERADGSDVAFSVQLTGDEFASRDHLSCIGLGDSEELVVRQLGPPSEKVNVGVDSAGYSTVALRYHPSPISIELVNGRVHSLRVWRPEGVKPRLRSVSGAFPPS